MCLSWLGNVEMDVLALLRMIDVEVAGEGHERIIPALISVGAMQRKVRSCCCGRCSATHRARLRCAWTRRTS